MTTNELKRLTIKDQVSDKYKVNDLDAAIKKLAHIEDIEEHFGVNVETIAQDLESRIRAEALYHQCDEDRYVCHMCGNELFSFESYCTSCCTDRIE